MLKMLSREQHYPYIITILRVGGKGSIKVYGSDMMSCPILWKSVPSIRLQTLLKSDKEAFNVC